jgi:hydrogenase maturation protease
VGPGFCRAPFFGFQKQETVKILILGIGNLLRTDDGVGLHVIEALRKEDLGDSVDLMEGLTGLDILDAMKGYDKVIIVDAIQTGGIPGQIHKLSLKDLKNKQTAHSFSTHLNMDFQTMIELSEKLFPEKKMGQIVILAVEAEDTTTISDKCTAKVEDAITKVIGLIKQLM